ncbi:DUF4287 domain-containing protein [Nocardioides litoris]|uniref:DUF4287 domain-containing protein n=1 Tax=Nocardioides litoris TaxID=1926648 RepID=UPI001FEA5A69|nr:DUF4287 domain-containing protein [Nocardioides litoris]
MPFQAYLDAAEKKTGKTPQEIVDLAHARGFGPDTKATPILAWLVDDLGLGRGHGMALVHVIENPRHQRRARRHHRHPPRRVRRAAARRPGPPLERPSGGGAVRVSSPWTTAPTVPRPPTCPTGPRRCCAPRRPRPSRCR